MEINVLYYLLPSLVMFCCGVYGFLTRKNMIAMLISLELMLNAVDINFTVINRYLYPETGEGMFFFLFFKPGILCVTALAVLEPALVDQAGLELTEIHLPLPPKC